MYFISIDRIQLEVSFDDKIYRFFLNLRYMYLIIILYVVYMKTCILYLHPYDSTFVEGFTLKNFMPLGLSSLLHLCADW